MICQFDLKFVICVYFVIVIYRF